MEELRVLTGNIDLDRLSRDDFNKLMSTLIINRDIMVQFINDLNLPNDEIVLIETLKPPVYNVVVIQDNDDEYFYELLLSKVDKTYISIESIEYSGFSRVVRVIFKKHIFDGDVK